MKKTKKKRFAIIVKVNGCFKSYFGLNKLDLEFAMAICDELCLSYDVYIFEKSFLNSTKLILKGEKKNV